MGCDMLLSTTSLASFNLLIQSSVLPWFPLIHEQAKQYHHVWSFAWHADAPPNYSSIVILATAQPDPIHQRF